MPQQNGAQGAARAGFGRTEDRESFSASSSAASPDSFDEAIRQARLYLPVFITPPTTDAIIDRASELARANGLQFWECVVCAASAGACATALLTEDMQDGRMLDGLRLFNPFDAANTKSIDDLLA